MSQALLVRILDLERRMAELEARLEDDSDLFFAKHFGKGRWQVLSPTGDKVGTEWLSREDAKKMADDLNRELP